MNVRCAAIFYAIAFLIIRAGYIASGSPELKLDNEVQTRTAELDSIKAKTEYLTSVLLEMPGDSEAAAVRRATAIGLLGELGVSNSIGTNAIGALIKNIAWVDRRSHSSPASHALMRIGEPVIPDLLKALESYPDTVTPHSAEEEGVWWTVMTISSIKKARYPEFVAEKKDKVPKKVWEKLVHYGSAFDVGR